MSPIVIIAVLIIILLKIYDWSFSRPKGCPPGPPRIPFFGSYLQILYINYKHLHKAALKLSEYYKSKIVSFYLGDFLVYAVHEPEAIKKVLSSSSFEGRPQLFLALIRHPEKKISGIFFQDGNIWREQRWFFLRFLRDYGFGRRFESLEQSISEEIQDLINLFRDGPKYPHEREYVNGSQFLAPMIFMPFATNCFFEVLFKEKYQRSEHYKLKDLCDSATMFARETSEYGRLLSMMPWIRFFFPKTCGYKSLMKANVSQYNFFKQKIETCLNNFDNAERDDPSFMDLYLRELRKDNKREGFAVDQLIMNCMDFSLPPSVGFPAQFSMLLQWLLINPKFLQNVQEEIDSVVGRGRLPTLDDRQYLPYTEACIRESMRIATLLPSSIVHLATEDTQLMGYNVPKDTPVIASLHALHNDEDLWENPKEFKPERFLDENGWLCLKKDRSLPFGAGKRLCPGETFARNLMFLFFSGLAQNINFELRKEDKFEHPNDNFTGIISIPRDFWINYSVRD